MISRQIIMRPTSFSALPKAKALAGANPLVHIILAFWALWHCRHARPPDFSLAVH